MFARVFAAQTFSPNAFSVAEREGCGRDVDQRLGRGVNQVHRVIACRYRAMLFRAAPFCAALRRVRGVKLLFGFLQVSRPHLPVALFCSRGGAFAF